MEPYYVCKHLGNAVEELLTRDAPLLDRLKAAFLESCLLFEEEEGDAGIDPRALPHIQKLRAARETDPEAPETGAWYRLEQMEPEERESLARAFLRAFIFQAELAKIKP